MAKEFSDSASCLDPKTAAIHGRRPSGVSGSDGYCGTRKVKGVAVGASPRPLLAAWTFSL